ncbi:MAG: hypothetical protein JSR67_10930 [Proteobacteria bacterium]|nr:hypothetical protein [Pseudomonadota bacterium]
MHTAFEIKESMFAVTVGGKVSTRDDLLHWDARDRLGVVVTSPYGALNAGLLTLLCVSAFYDVPKQKRRLRPLYPSIYLFHVGGRWGFCGEFDFWPDRKEIFTSSAPSDILQAVNAHAVTHLALPAGIEHEITYRYKEPEEAIDRIRQCYLYGPDGAADDADVTLATSSPEVLRNFERTLDLQGTLALREKQLSEDNRLRPGSPAGDDARRYISLMRDRLNEVSCSNPVALRISGRLTEAIAQGSLTERLRRVDMKTALRLLAQ